MKNKFLVLLAFIISFPTLSKPNCVPNTIGVDMCAKARGFVDFMAPQLPITVNKYVAWYSVASIDTSIIATYRFTYTRSYLEELAKKNKSSIAEAKEAMKLMTNNICSQEAQRAFINLGGKWVANYVFSDSELFLRHIVEKCN